MSAATSCCRAREVLSLHAPLDDETRGMVDRELLARLPEGALLVNTARGELVDEAALVRALDSGRLAGAALDALAEEPPRPGHPLVGRDDVIVTSHVGGAHRRGARRDGPPGDGRPAGRARRPRRRAIPSR